MDEILCKIGRAPMSVTPLAVTVVVALAAVACAEQVKLAIAGPGAAFVTWCVPHGRALFEFVTAPELPPLSLPPLLFACRVWVPKSGDVYESATEPSLPCVQYRPLRGEEQWSVTRATAHSYRVATKGTWQGDMFTAVLEGLKPLEQYVYRTGDCEVRGGGRISNVVRLTRGSVLVRLSAGVCVGSPAQVPLPCGAHSRHDSRPAALQRQVCRCVSVTLWPSLSVEVFLSVCVPLSIWPPVCTYRN